MTDNSDSEMDTSTIYGDTNVKRGSRAVFTVFETERLLSCVEERKTVLECKKTGIPDIDRKRRAWEQLATDFNSHSDVAKKSARQLQKKWENLKGRAKKDVSYICEKFRIFLIFFTCRQ